MGGSGNDSLSGDGGNDTLVGGSGNDTLEGGSGNDSINGNDDNASIDGGDGDDFVHGGAGNDTVRGGAGRDTVVGGTGNDLLYGDGGDDQMWGQEGGDSLYGGAGNDLVRGGDGNDALDGGSGDDTIVGDHGDDVLHGGDGADALYGQEGADALYGGAGNDSLDGGSGDDYLVGGDGSDLFHFTDGGGNDKVFGGEGGTDNDTLDLSALTAAATVTYTGNEAGTAVHGSDTITFSQIETLILTDQNDSVDGSSDAAGLDIDAGAGNDTVGGGSGNDRIDGGTGDDIISGEDGRDSFFGGDGDDQIFGGDGDDSVSGGDGNDYIEGQAGNDVLDGGAGDDVIDGGDGHDTITGGGGNDFISGESGNDSISGGAGDDTLTGADGNDTVYGDAGSDLVLGEDGDDLVDGGEGDDSLDGGTGNNTITGGAGNDHFGPGGGNDTITDFNFGNTGTLDDGDSTNNDFIHLSGYYDHISELYADQADDGVLNQSNTTDSRGNATDYSDNDRFGSGSLTVRGASADSSSFTQENTGVVCFTSGTAIRTPSGDVLVEELQVGDLVTTIDNGPQRICWIGRRMFDGAALRASPALRPVLVRRGVLGTERDLLVSPQHGLLIGGGGGHLVRAIHLAQNMAGVRVAQGKRQVCYIHLMFEAHQIVLSENAPSESFYPGPMALRMMEAPACAELLYLFPELSKVTDKMTSPENVYGQTSRTFTAKRQVARLLG